VTGWLDEEARIVALDDALATAGMTYVIPHTVRVRVAAVTFTLTAAAGGGVRRPAVLFVDGTGQTVVAAGSPFTRSAGAASVFSFGVDLEQFGANDAAIIGAGLPRVALPDNVAVVVSVVGAQAADKLSHGRLLLAQSPVDVATPA
jgi:hypothetical protein